jgi:phage baseplate assembly protein V
VPRLGDLVTVLHYPTGVERGVVVCSHNTSANPGFQPRSLNSIAMQADDGAYFEYDPDQGCLSLNGLGTVYLKHSGEMEIHSGGNVTVTAANVTIQGGTITLQGNVHITGSLTVDQTVTFNKDGSIATHLTNDDGAGGGS